MFLLNISSTYFITMTYQYLWLCTFDTNHVNHKAERLPRFLIHQVIIYFFPVKMLNKRFLNADVNISKEILTYYYLLY